MEVNIGQTTLGFNINVSTCLSTLSLHLQTSIPTHLLHTSIPTHLLHTSQPPHWHKSSPPHLLHVASFIVYPCRFVPDPSRCTIRQSSITDTIPTPTPIISDTNTIMAITTALTTDNAIANKRALLLHFGYLINLNSMPPKNVIGILSI